MTASKSVSARPAPLWLRLLAAIYDLLPLLALWFASTVLILAASGGAFDVHRVAHKVMLQTVVVLVSASYFALSWSRGGQTIGMRPWRLRIVSADGGSVTLRMSLVRFAIALFSLAPAGLGFWWALVDAQRRTWHDIAAGTVMVQLEKRSAGS